MSSLLFSTAAGTVALITGMTALAQDLPDPRAAPPAPYGGPPPAGYPGQAMPGAGMGAGMGGGRSITRDQVPAMVSRGFATLDTNGDGVVTRAEYEAFREQRRAERMARRGDRGAPPPGANADAPPSPPGGGGAMPGGMGGGGRGLGPVMSGPRWFETADANGDGRVTLAEAQAAGLAAFDRMDTNRDGTVTPDERRAAMMAMRGRGPN